MGHPSLPKSPAPFLTSCACVVASRRPKFSLLCYRRRRRRRLLEAKLPQANFPKVSPLPNTLVVRPHWQTRVGIQKPPFDRIPIGPLRPRPPRKSISAVGGGSICERVVFGEEQDRLLRPAPPIRAGISSGRRSLLAGRPVRPSRRGVSGLRGQFVRHRS